MTGLQRDSGPGHLRGKDTIRPRRAWLLVVLLVLVVPVVVAAMYYDPLVQGSAGTCPEGSQPASDPGGLNETCFIDYAEGLELRYGVAVRNTGPLPVEVVAIEPAELGELAATTGTWMRSDPGSEIEEPVPFVPFTLEVGQEREVLVAAELRSCELYEGELVEVTDLTVRQRAFWLTRSVTIPLHTSVSVVIQDCG